MLSVISFGRTEDTMWSLYPGNLLNKGSKEGPKPPLAGVWGCPPDIIFSPFLGRKALPGQEGEGGPDGPHGDWSKGFFITLLVWRLINKLIKYQRDR